MLRFYLLATGSENAGLASLDRDRLSGGTVDDFPSGYEKFLDGIKNSPLFQITENIISFFDLGSHPWNVAYLNAFQDLVLIFTGSRNSGMQAFLDWWETTGQYKSVVLPGNQDAARVLTIHKSKGLEFRVVILPFLSWDLDHKSTMQPFLWVTPKLQPFSDLGIIPVKYSKGLLETVFETDYLEEKFSVYLDNVNLLYVAMTRAKEAIYGFAPADISRESCIAGVIRDAFNDTDKMQVPGTVCLNDYFDNEKNIFEYGRLEGNEKSVWGKTDITLLEYPVYFGMKSLNIKLHWENYFSVSGREKREKINYGKLMHEVFERIKTSDDVKKAVGMLVNEGQISASEFAGIEKNVTGLISSPQVSEWFLPGNTVLTESEILTPSGFIRRPDRVIIRDGKTVVVDFKFGEENPHHIRQVAQYRTLLSEMGYDPVESFIWYIDSNIIVRV
jgi:CRISPR/Cas system-associated exonuclease Cas4 (RecB family)